MFDVRSSFKRNELDAFKDEVHRLIRRDKREAGAKYAKFWASMDVVWQLMDEDDGVSINSECYGYERRRMLVTWQTPMLCFSDMEPVRELMNMVDAFIVTSSGSKVDVEIVMDDVFAE